MQYWYLTETIILRIQQGHQQVRGGQLTPLAMWQRVQPPTTTLGVLFAIRASRILVVRSQQAGRPANDCAGHVDARSGTPDI